jgi:glycyl-tRNA synthetase beta chain
VVKEFPELQGRVGEHYARLDGEPAGAAAALAGQYLPRGEWDPVLDDDAAAIVSLAEKADSLAAYFSIDEVPTGTADPFGLRRHALGLLRILAKKEWPISIEAALRPACDAWRLLPPARDALHAFAWGRADQVARSSGFTDYVDAVGALTARPYFEYRLRLLALRELARRPTWRELVALVERTRNMGRASSRGTDDGLPAEAKAIRVALDSFKPGEEPVKFAAKYLETFGPRVAKLFDSVLVEDAKDPARSASIKHLLHEVHALFAERLGDLRRLGAGAKPAKP